MIGMAGELSAYELKRLENIRQNQKILEALEVPKLAPVEQMAVNTAKSARSAPKSRPKPTLRAKPKPLRVSRRLLEKQEEELSGKAKRRLAREELLKELPEPPVKPKKPRPLPGSRVLFAPEEGATAGFIAAMKAANKDVMCNPNREASLLSGSPKMGIKSAGCVTKVLQERIYSVALHPSTDRIITATGSKNGQLAFWDATALYHDHDMTFAGGQSPYYLFAPHSGSVATLKFNPGNASQLISCGYEGSIQCMDIVKGHFDTLYSAPRDLDEQYISSFDFFAPSAGNVLAFSDMSGFASILDRRAPIGQVERFHLHQKKIGGLSISPVNPDLIATCSLDNVVCIWDRRALKAEESIPLVRFDSTRAVTAVSFHPTLQDSIVSTCYDDHIRIYHKALSESPTELAVRHNNQTGRWITTFKAFWDPKSTADTSHVIVGDMNRGIDLIDGRTGVTHNFTSDYLTAQPAVNGAHPTLDLIVSGNASGKLALWTPF